jgi:hypothetical protein
MIKSFVLFAKSKPLLLLAILFFTFAVMCIFACAAHADNSRDGSSGGATGFGVIASALIICGSFFLYKHLEKKDNKQSF